MSPILPPGLRCLAFGFLLLVAAGSASTSDPQRDGTVAASPETKEKKKAPKPDGDQGERVGEIHRVEAGPFRIEVKLEGVVESGRESPVAFDLERWSDLEVVRAVAHGKRVEKGDPLIELETAELEREIEERKAKMPGTELEVAQLEREIRDLEDSNPVELEKERRETERAQRDLAHFEEVGRAMREREAEENVEDAEESLAYAEEELRQLEKMYGEDDLTEETEEIILRRARHTAARQRWRLKRAKVRAKRTVETELPREHENLETEAKLEKIDWRTREESLEADLEEKRIEREEKRRELEETRRELRELRSDLGDMTARAPHDGLVYYGASRRGKWEQTKSVEEKLRPGGSPGVREIVMTVVDPARVQLRVAVPEAKLTDLAAGQGAEVSLKWKPEPSLGATVESVSHVPFADNTFDALLTLDDEGGVDPILPGMKADIRVEVYEKEDALLVPAKAIRKKKDRETVVLEGGERRRVRTGRSKGDRVEIREGLEEGDRIRLPETDTERDGGSGGGKDSDGGKNTGGEKGAKRGKKSDGEKKKGVGKESNRSPKKE